MATDTTAAKLLGCRLSPLEVGCQLLLCGSFHTFVEHLLYAGPCGGPWRYRDKKGIKELSSKYSLSCVGSRYRKGKQQGSKSPEEGKQGPLWEHIGEVSVV